MTTESVDPSELLRDQVVIVLVRPQQPGNVGAVARAMKNSGLRRLVLVLGPPTSTLGQPQQLHAWVPHMDIDRARWMAPGSSEILDQARYVSSIAEAVADCTKVIATTARNRQWSWPAQDLQGVVPAIFEQQGRTAILFGPEDSGLSNEDISYAHALLHIPTDSHASLNLSQAVLLTAHAIFEEARRRGHLPEGGGIGLRGGPRRGAAPSPVSRPPAAPQEKVEWLLQEWMQTIELCGYLKGHEPILVASTLRQLLQRAEIEEREIIALRGMFKKMRVKMKLADGKPPERS